MCQRRINKCHAMKKLIFIGLLLPALAMAEITPPQGYHDPRVRVVEYNPLNVVKLSTFFGVSTHIQFADSESIKDVAVGDDQAWKVIPRGNHLFIKPQATNADTNITVVTDKRTYQFALVVQQRPVKDSTAWSDPNLIFSLSFKYPEEDSIKKASEAKREAIKDGFGEYKNKFINDVNNTKTMYENRDYWVAGSEEISPTVAFDDARFIFLKFSNNSDIPAVYEVDDQGNEALINISVHEGGHVVVQRLVHRLMLRKGSAVASVVNRSFQSNGGVDNTTGTVSPVVERVIKGSR